VEPEATPPVRPSAAHAAVVERDSELDRRPPAETKEPAVSAESADDPIVPLLIDELHGLLTMKAWLRE
jgi:hypothetical protein